MMSCLRMSKVLGGLGIVALAGFACLSASAQTAATPNPAAANFKTNCVMCHGADGAGSAFGKRLAVPDLRSKDVQNTPADALAKIITSGKNNMPAFGTRLDNTQIQDLVKYIRQLHPTPDNAK